MSNDKVDASFHPEHEPWIMGEIDKAAEREPKPAPTWEEIISPAEDLRNQTLPPAPPSHRRR